MLVPVTFFCMSNLGACKHAVDLASAKGVSELLVIWCKQLPRLASKALYQSKFKGKKPHQSARSNRRTGATKRAGLQHLRPFEIVSPTADRGSTVITKLATDSYHLWGWPWLTLTHNYSFRRFSTHTAR